MFLVLIATSCGLHVEVRTKKKKEEDGEMGVFLKF